MYVHVCMYVCTCMHVCMYIMMYKCMYMYAYMYIIQQYVHVIHVYKYEICMSSFDVCTIIESNNSIYIPVLLGGFLEQHKQYTIQKLINNTTPVVEELTGYSAPVSASTAK